MAGNSACNHEFYAITVKQLREFMENEQGEKLLDEELELVIQRHEPNPFYRSRALFSFVGFARYLLDKDNYAFESDIAQQIDYIQSTATSKITTNNKRFSPNKSGNQCATSASVGSPTLTKCLSASTAIPSDSVPGMSGLFSADSPHQQSQSMDKQCQQLASKDG